MPVNILIMIVVFFRTQILSVIKKANKEAIIYLYRLFEIISAVALNGGSVATVSRSVLWQPSEPRRVGVGGGAPSFGFPVFSRCV